MMSTRALLFASLAAVLVSVPAVAKDFTITLPDKDWDVTMNSLQKLPWIDANPVILKVWDQIKAQQVEPDASSKTVPTSPDTPAAMPPPVATTPALPEDKPN